MDLSKDSSAVKINSGKPTRSALMNLHKEMEGYKPAHINVGDPKEDPNWGTIYPVKFTTGSQVVDVWVKMEHGKATAIG